MKSDTIYSNIIFNKIIQHNAYNNYILCNNNTLINNQTNLKLEKFAYI